MKKTHIFLWIIFTVVYVLVFKVLFSNSPLSWGDAPFFYPENLNNLFNLPFLWDFRNNNFGAPQFQILWLYIPTFLYGVLYTFFGLENNSLIRIIFYLPATILAIVGSWLFISQFTKNYFAKFAGTFLYTFNTYFLLLLDGGQVGVALSYGLFPVVCWMIVKYSKKFSFGYFLSTVFLVFLISNVDLRIAILAIVFSVLLFLLEGLLTKYPLNFKQNFFKFLSVLIFVSFLNAFWLIPMVMSSNSSFSISENSIGLIGLMNSFLLFQPQFPLNEFGTSLPIPFYFGFVPLVIFSGWLFLVKRQIDNNTKYLVVFSILYLFYAFLAKGSQEPLGQMYFLAVNNIPLGVAFRDSSKFFIPLLLTAGCLLAISIETLNINVKKEKIKIFFQTGVLLLLMVLIYPALIGNLSGALREQKGLAVYETINQNLSNQEKFFRTVWFDEKPPLGFASWKHPAISANSLYKLRPFASITTGSYDLYGFLHKDQLTNWFDLLGIKYAFFPENQREKIWDENDRKERNQFIDFVSKIPNFKLINWQTGFPVLEVTNTRPHIFGQNVLVAVIGGEGIYNQLFQNKDFDLSKQGFVFLEDGNVDPNFLKMINKGDLALLFDDSKSKEDLAMTFLQDKFLGVVDAKQSNWGFYNSNDYLKWKYELLKHGVESYDFDFGKGIGFSSIQNERIEFNVPVPLDGRYFIAVRHTNATNSATLKMKVNNQEFKLFNENPDRFKWSIIGPVDISKKVEIHFENEGGFQAINTVAVVSENDLIATRKQSDDIIRAFPSFNINEANIYQKFVDKFNPLEIGVGHKMHNPTKYQLTVPKNTKWFVFTDSYDENWKLQNTTQSVLPGYAIINYFYVGDLTQNIDDSINLQLTFTPQQSEGKWLMISVFTGTVFVFLCIGRLVYKISKR